MASELKTKPRPKADVRTFLSKIPHPVRRADAYTLLTLMEKATGEKGVRWGPTMVGFGTYTYMRSDKKTFTWMASGFAPRGTHMVVYIIMGFQSPAYQALLKKLGPHTKSRSCLYIRTLKEVHLPTLLKLVAKAHRDVKRKYA